jgi:hypothetical protein
MKAHSDSTTGAHPRRAVRTILEEIRELFTRGFDQNWLLMLLDQQPLEPGTMSEIRDLLDPASPNQDDPIKLLYRADVLAGFVAHVRRFILPGLREKLGVSGLLPDPRARDRERRVYYTMVCHVFPANVDRLEQLSGQLRDAAMARARSRRPRQASFSPAAWATP